jgi:hypothetical protein
MDVGAPTHEVVRFDELAPEPITVWDLVGGKLVERPREGLTSHECKTLGLFWTVEQHRTYGPQLRLARDREGKRILATPDENELRLAQELAHERRDRAIAEHDKMLAQQLQQREADARAIADHDKMLAQPLQQREADARAIAETKQLEEARARAIAESKRAEAVRKQRTADTKRRTEAKARALAEKKQREEAEARTRLEDENARLRAELEQLRKHIA